MTHVYGLDGCKGGWCAVRLDVENERITLQEPEILSFNEIIASGAAVIGIDIPIGLLEPADATRRRDASSGPALVQRLSGAVPPGAALLRLTRRLFPRLRRKRAAHRPPAH